MTDVHRPDKERTHFDTAVRQYEDMHRLRRFGFSEKKRQRKLDWIAKSVRLHERTNVLEIGCGTGWSTVKWAKESSATIYALDISLGMLQMAASTRSHSRIIYLQASAENLPFPDAAFDAVIGTFILHHLNLEYVLPEVYRVCRAGAYIGFVEPNMLNPLVFAIDKISMLRQWWGNSPHETAFVRWQLKKLFAEHGFEQVRVENIGFAPARAPIILQIPLETLGCMLEQVPVLKEISGSLLVSACRE